MALIDEYKRQFAWRSWGPILDSLPPLAGRTVLDLGCAIGDQAVELVARGARVVGIDANEELLSEAQSRGIAGAEFRCADLCALPELHVPVDGIWCSFAAAYFPDLAAALASWTGVLRAGGWIALTEIDDMFGHAPLSERSRALLDAFAEDALRAGRYDLRMGRKLAGHLERAGFVVSKILTFDDAELSFHGAAATDVLDAWRARFERMPLLQRSCGDEFEGVRDEFLECLARADHSSLAKVYCCVASWPGA
jgi:SAM-dependent methyltransferase